MRFAAAALAFACGLMAQAALAADPDTDWSLIQGHPPGGVFHASQVPGHPAPGGFALSAIDGRWQLVPATLVGHADPAEAETSTATASSMA